MGFHCSKIFRRTHLKTLKLTSSTLKSLFVLFIDVTILYTGNFFALLLRYDFVYSLIPERDLNSAVRFAPIQAAIMIAVFLLIKIYNTVWRYVSIRDIAKISAGVIITAAICTPLSIIINMRLPLTIYAVTFMTTLILIIFTRCSYPALQYLIGNMDSKPKSKTFNIMIIGAGEAGYMIVRDIKHSKYLNARVCCFIDDNPQKINRYLEGVKIVGGRDFIPQAAMQYKIDQIIFAIPSAPAQDKHEILNICKKTGCELKTIPGIYQLVTGEVTLQHIRDVQIEDLLSRDTVNVDTREILNALEGKVVLVTGGGGSIGSELCRQIAAHKPKQLLILDIYENNAYDLQQELKRKYPSLNLVVLIASVREADRMDKIFARYRPQIVYHAAAHKHVPLMEANPNEAIKNNVFGTYKTASCAVKYGAEKFVMISTDKAVNPTNIMGASKRLCEMIIQCFNGKSDTLLAAVRFGNVLGSNGSVIPLFKRQISEGGPVTVTHPDIIRYFMTIPEAVSLVLRAGSKARGGEIFVLDMGEPVKIDDLARNLIRLSGFTPDVDIKIEYTGLRPGEKLYEELLMNEEGLLKTDNELIYIGKPVKINEEEFFADLEKLREACYSNSDDIKDIVARMVPTYKVETKQCLTK